MNKFFQDQREALLPSDFFNFEVEMRLGKELTLPDTSSFLGEESFATFYLMLQKEMVTLTVKVKKPFEEALYPQYQEGDSLELFIDTRDLKSAGFITRFCHHFLILPVEVNGVASREITRFRTEDTHPLCDPEDLQVVTEFGSSSYTLEVKIPGFCLHGYEPTSFNRLGFTYRLNRAKGLPQHFSHSSQLYNLADQPSLWASISIT